ncbi:MAG: secretin N-terminal domain-containing protein [Planctomycetia bacterium]|nr:secretin N-terminal domain-containing protein [Planctomycetia bacterium]
MDVAPAAAPAVVAPGGPVPPPGAMPVEGQPAGTPPGGAPAQPPAADAAAAQTPAKRPTEPAQPANPVELQARPDADGMVTFSFKGQPWPAVLEWLADISDKSLEWQEAPPGFVDLTTRGKYGVAEVRDLLNSILLARGYTILDSGEVLLVVNLAKLDVSLVPRVKADELDARGGHELVKTFFDLNRLRADAVAEELKPLLSPYGKIAALKTTNRLDVLETAGNLRRIRDLLIDEQDSSGQQFEVREFTLRFARAEDVIQTVSKLLGIKSADAAAPMSPEQMQQQQMMMQQQMQMQQQQGGQPAMPSGPSEIYLAANKRENSVLAHASADKLALIEQTISFLDVPSRQGQGALGATLPRVQVYRLSGIDPEPVVKVLREMGGLDPTSTLEIDKKNKAIIANAPLADHVMIRALIERLDGSGRRFEVVKLRRLSAEYVAGSIEFLFAGPKKDDSSQRRQRYYYGYYGGGEEEETKEKDSFQVEADVRNNRLLLRANDVELEEVRMLLVKLGEIDPEGVVRNNSRKVRVPAGKESEDLLRRLKQMWPSVSPNPLLIDPGAAPAPEQPTEPEQKAPAKVDDATAMRSTSLFALAMADEAELAPRSAPSSDAPSTTPEVVAEREAEAVAAPSVPAITITQGPDGLVISSQDGEALDRMMELLDELTPVEMSYRVFELKNTYAKDVSKLLKDVFEEKKKEEDRNPFGYYYFDYPQEEEKEERGRLSKKRPLKFVPDPVTNTVLVQGADEEQLAEIESLIEMYDRPDPVDSQSVRKTEIVQIKYAVAPEVLTVIKDVYRDLLSPNDPALQQAQPQQEQRPSLFSLLRDEQNAIPRFKGLLSVGVNAKTNSLVISAPQFLLDDVKSMVQELDDAAMPDRPVAQVRRVNGIVNDPLMRAIITNVANPNATSPANAQQNNQQQNNNDSGREERRRRGRERNENRERNND